MHTRTHLHAPRGPVFLRNRRHHTRVDARGVASHLHTRDASAPGLAVENISMGGVFVRSAAALEVGTPVMLQVVRPGLKRALELTGRVASVVSPAEAGLRGMVAGMGICLDATDADTEQRLRALVDDLAATAPAAPPPTAPIPEQAVPTAEELALATARGEAQARRIAQLEAELAQLRKEMLRRNRTVGELANRLAAFEVIRAAG